MSYSLNRGRRLPAILLGVAVALAVAMAGVPSASAHTLSIDRAERAANAIGQTKVNSPRNDYAAHRVMSCTRLFPHQVLCKIGYDTRGTLPTSRYDCVDWRTIFYRSHSEAGQSTRVFHSAYGGRHEC